MIETHQTLQEKTTDSKQGQAPETSPTEIPESPDRVPTAGIAAEPDASSTSSSTAPLPHNVKMQMEAEQKISSNVMSICLTADGLVIRDEDKLEPEEASSRLSGVYCEGIQYYDLSGVQYINNTGMAILIDLLKALLEMGVEVQFVNVHDSIKKKIREMGLEKIINYGDNKAS